MWPMRGDRTPPRWCSLAVRVLVLGLVVRSAIPLGYMPGNLLAGEFMVLCPTGVPAELLQALSGHHAHHEMSTVDIDRECPIGSALTPAWIGSDWLFDDRVEREVGALPAYDSQSFRSATFLAYRQRAPPQV